MSNSSIVIDLDNPRTGLVAEALSNKTCVKIISLLAEQELTASDIANKLHIPLNTTGYNIDKLIASGLVEKSSNFFWSVKGKKTLVYKVVNKRIIISPKRSVKGFLPAVIVSGLVALALKIFYSGTTNYSVSKMAVDSVETALYAAASNQGVSNSVTSLLNLGWIWFIAGALFSLIVASLWDWFYFRRSFK